MAEAGILIAALVFGYLLGSIPFGLLFTRFAGLGDVRAIGSGSIGATNVLRTGRKDLTGATVICDALKGTVAALIAWRFGLDAALAAAAGAFLGHLFPVWLGFRGGKGVATYVGLVLAFSWIAVLVFAVLSLIALVMHRGNIGRLLAGTESKIGAKSAPTGGA